MFYVIVKAVHKHLSTKTIEIEKHEREKAGEFAAVKLMIISKGQCTTMYERVEQKVLLTFILWQQRTC